MALNAVDPETIIASSTTGKPVLQVQIPADMSKVKAYKGAKFINIKMTAWSLDAKPIHIIIAGKDEPLDIPIAFGAPTPENSLSSADAHRTTICLNLSQCGILGRALEVLENDFLTQVQKPESLAALWGRAAPPHFPTHIKRKYGENAKDQTKAGLMRDDPLVTLVFDFSKYPAKFNKALEGKPRSTVYDWASRQINNEGVEVFLERTDDVKNPICMANASQVLASNDTIRRIALTADSATTSQTGGVSMRVTIYKIWTERSKAEMNFLPSAKASTSAPAPVHVPVPAPVPAPASAPGVMQTNEDGTYAEQS